MTVVHWYRGVTTKNALCINVMMFLLTSRRESISGESGRALHTHWNLPWTNLLRTQRHSTLRTSCFSLSREFTARPREVLERKPEFPPNRQAAPFSESSARLQTATKLEHFLHCVPVKRASRKTSIFVIAYRTRIFKSRELSRPGLSSSIAVTDRKATRVRQSPRSD